MELDSLTSWEKIMMYLGSEIFISLTHQKSEYFQECMSWAIGNENHPKGNAVRKVSRTPKRRFCGWRKTGKIFCRQETWKSSRSLCTTERRDSQHSRGQWKPACSTHCINFMQYDDSIDVRVWQSAKYLSWRSCKFIFRSDYSFKWNNARNSQDGVEWMLKCQESHNHYNYPLAEVPPTAGRGEEIEAERDISAIWKEMLVEYKELVLISSSNLNGKKSAKRENRKKPFYNFRSDSSIK